MKNKFKYSKLLANDWVITLTATLIGVFVALYLNERITTHKHATQKGIAIENILAEISTNADNLVTVIEKHRELNEIMGFLVQYLDEEDNLIVDPELCYAFRSKYPDIIIIEDSTSVGNNLYNYDGEINFDLSFPHFELTTITLKTLKSSGIANSFNFECLLHLENVENITNEVTQKNRELFDYLLGVTDGGDKNERIVNHVKLLIDYEEALSRIYASSEKKLQKCY